MMRPLLFFLVFALAVTIGLVGYSFETMGEFQMAATIHRVALVVALQLFWFGVREL